MSCSKIINNLLHDKSIDEKILFNFYQDNDLEKWEIITDSVMGGVSKSKLSMDNAGFAIFSGILSVTNNGGFAMISAPLNAIVINNEASIVIEFNGDNKYYELRIKSDPKHQYWFKYSFNASKRNQRLEIPLYEFYPSYRGKILDKRNFFADVIKEMAILIKSKKNESFQFKLHKISLKHAKTFDKRKI